MRYDTPVFFQKITPGEYDASSGNYSANIIEETKRFASVTDSGTETLKLVYGGIKQGSLIIRLQTPYKADFEHIRIGSKVYNVDFSRKQKVFVVSEVQ